MNLQDLLVQYYAQQRFYAGEVAYRLTAKQHETAWEVLCVLYERGTSMTIDKLFSACKRTTATQEGFRQALSRLVDEGLLVCLPGRIYHYRLSDFAVVVVRAGLPSPVERMAKDTPHTCKESGNVHRSIPWQEEGPEVERLRAEGWTLTEIAQERHIPRTTLYRYLRRRGLHLHQNVGEQPKGALYS